MSPRNIAVVQFDPQVGLERRDANATRVLELAGDAVGRGADLVVVPELASTGYTFHDREEAYAHSEPVPDGPTVESWIEFAQRHGVYFAGGLVERDGVRLYDTAVLVGPDGYIGRYRKTHLWNREKLWFTAGDEGLPVFDTPIGRIGLLICWDIWFPEVPRILAQQGADLICSLNNWVWTPPPLLDEGGRCMASYLTMAAAHSNNVVIAAAGRVGTERGAKFLGCSLIAGANGWPVAGVADAEEETTLLAEVDVVASRSALIWNDLNDLHRDRRTDLYDQMLGYRLAGPLPR